MGAEEEVLVTVGRGRRRVAVDDPATTDASLVREEQPA